MEGFKRKNKEEKHQELQNLDLLGSPHLEEEWIGGMVDLDLLSCFPKNWQESLEGSGGIKLSRFATMEEREGKNCVEKWGRRPLFIGATKSGRWRGKNGGSPTPRPRAGQHPARPAGASQQAAKRRPSAH